jgi:hypothetical protein
MIAERMRAQLLTGEAAKDPVSVTRTLLAVQGQDQRGARLAIRVRSSGLCAADVDRALSEQRTLLITWLNRGTLHLVSSEDYPWLFALTTPPLLRGNARRLAQEGVTPRTAERAVSVIERALSDEGPLTRAELGERLSAARVPTEGQALVHLLMLASLRGLTVRGPMRGPQHAYVLVRDWLGEQPRVDRETALAELARRYLVGHGPAEDRDLAKWAGLGLRDARAGLQAIGSELEQRDDGLVDLSRAEREHAEFPPPRLLGPFDPLLLGWRSREAILGPHSSIVTVNGLFRAFALVDGRAVATWRMPAGEVVLEALQKISARDTAALSEDAEDVVRYLRCAGGEQTNRRERAR